MGRMLSSSYLSVGCRPRRLCSCTECDNAVLRRLKGCFRTLAARLTRLAVLRSFGNYLSLADPHGKLNWTHTCGFFVGSWLSRRTSSKYRMYVESFCGGRSLFSAFSNSSTPERPRICLQGVHERPDLWPEPMRYSPSRFMETVAPYTFLPFIDGPRNCLGQHLSLLESKVQHGSFVCVGRVCCSSR